MPGGNTLFTFKSGGDLSPLSGGYKGMHKKDGILKLKWGKGATLVVLGIKRFLRTLPGPTSTKISIPSLINLFILSSQSTG